MMFRARIALPILGKREAGCASEARRLLDTALEIMRQGGTAARPRVADIVAAAHHDGMTRSPRDFLRSTS
jgi:hypothetical protein